MSDADPEKPKRVTDAMLKMQKIIVADLQKAYDGHRLLHNLLSSLAEITSRYLNTSLVIYAALCNSNNFLLDCPE